MNAPKHRRRLRPGEWGQLWFIVVVFGPALMLFFAHGGSDDDRPLVMGAGIVATLTGIVWSSVGCASALHRQKKEKEGAMNARSSVAVAIGLVLGGVAVGYAVYFASCMLAWSTSGRL